MSGQLRETESGRLSAVPKHALNRSPVRGTLPPVQALFLPMDWRSHFTGGGHFFESLWGFAGSCRPIGSGAPTLGDSSFPRTSPSRLAACPSQRIRTKSSGARSLSGSPRNRNRPRLVETISPGNRVSSSRTRLEAASAISSGVGCRGKKLLCRGLISSISSREALTCACHSSRLIWEGSRS